MSSGEPTTPGAAPAGGRGDKSPPADLKARLPHNLDAETAVLGTLLVRNELFHDVAARLTVDDFYEALHAKVFAAISQLLADNRRADLITLTPLIKDLDFADANPIDYVAALPDLAVDDTRAMAYVEEIVHYAAQRALLHTGRDLAAVTNRPGAPLADIGLEVLRRVDDALGRVRTQEETGNMAAAYGALAIERTSDENAPQGIKTRLADLDHMTGGLFRGEYSIVGGRPGMGKTAVAIQLALNAARQGHGTLFFSLEMSGEAMAQRMLSNLSYAPTSAIPYQKFRHRLFTDDERRRLGLGLDRLRDSPLYVETRSGLSISDITALARKMQAQWAEREKPQSLDLVIIDYLTLLKFSDRWKGQRVYEVGEASTALKALAKSLNVHVMAVHQLSRGVESRDDKRPMMSDLRESGQLEQDADLILLTYREAYYLERRVESEQDADKKEELEQDLVKCRNLLEIIVAKQRMGAVGTRKFYCAIDCNVIADLGRY